jgi:hypothetical protein
MEAGLRERLVQSGFYPFEVKRIFQGRTTAT